jgi:hypothetical protein
VSGLPEAIIGLFKTDLIHRRRPWRIDAPECATLERID